MCLMVKQVKVIDGLPGGGRCTLNELTSWNQWDDRMLVVSAITEIEP